MITVGYKATRRSRIWLGDFTLTSAFPIGEYEAVYKPDEWTIADTGSLFAFDTLENASLFLYAHKSLHFQIWECDLASVTPAPRRVPTMAYPLYDGIARFWENPYLYECGGNPMQRTPQGTLTARGIRITRRVSPCYPAIRVV